MSRELVVGSESDRGERRRGWCSRVRASGRVHSRGAVPWPRNHVVVRSDETNGPADAMRGG